MKRIYQTPETIKVVYYGDIVMDSNSTRGVGGGPTQGEGAIPTVVGETKEGTDPYGGHGQGSGGGGNRGKDYYDIWDDDEEF